MTTREQVEAEAEEYVRGTDNGPDGYHGFIAGRTVTAEQVEAARDSILYDKNRGIEIAIHSPGFNGKSLNDAATELATLAFRAAGLLIEGDDQ